MKRFLTWVLGALSVGLIAQPACAQQNGSRVGALVQQYQAADLFNGAVLVAERGRIIYRGSAGFANLEWNVAHTPDSRFEIASMTKPMTAILIMQLVQEKRVRLDATVSSYVPFLTNEAARTITVDQLLSHRSGLQQDIGFSDNGRQRR